MSTQVVPIPEYTLCVMSHEGDSRMQWDPEDPAQVAKVEAEFNALRAKGYAAYTVNSKGDKGTIIQKFDPLAERIIMALPMVGG
jgi:hypothetical protein